MSPGTPRSIPAFALSRKLSIRFSVQTLTQWIGPLPGRREAQAMSLMALTAGLIVCGLSIFRGFQGQTVMGRPLGGDFIEFYVIGKILNSYEAFRIYDLRLAVGLQHAILPTMSKTQMLVFGHAPFIAFLFKPFATLSYAWAYITWLVFSASLYATSIWLLFRSGNLPREQWKTGFLLAVSSVPFLFETWFGGQLSVVVFFVWAVFFYCRHNNWLFLSGLALSCVLFKPTLIALPALMLLCGRQWRMLSGLAAGTFAFAVASIQLVGLRGCRAWFDTLLANARITAGPGEVWRLAKLVDIASFFHLLIRNAPVLTAILSGIVVVTVLVWLATAWFRLGAGTSQSTENLLWAATICCTLVANSYAPIYDSVLVVSALVLAAGPLNQCIEDRESFKAWVFALYLIPWISQSVAEFLHVQIFTLLLISFAAWTVKLAYRDWEAQPASISPSESVSA